MSVESCKNCAEPNECVDEHGNKWVLDLDAEGFCEDCRDKKEYGKILAKEYAESLDFDYSMNY